jgi:hypothetical protein
MCKATDSATDSLAVECIITPLSSQSNSLGGVVFCLPDVYAFLLGYNIYYILKCKKIPKKIHICLHIACA